MIHEMKTAPRDGKLIWLFSEDEWAGPRAAYWGQVSGVNYWRALTGEWINGATGWSTIPIYSPTKDEAPCPVCGNEERAQGGYLSCECPASPSTDDFVSRAEVLRVIRSLGAQDADLAMYGAADNARAREYGEAAATRACCAIALMPAASPSPAPAAVEELVARMVKPLEWLSDNPPFFAMSPFCAYRIEGSDDDTGPHWETTISYKGSVYKRAATEDDAKAAAQADYTARILSALDATALSTLAADKAGLVAERDEAKRIEQQTFKDAAVINAASAAKDERIRELLTKLKLFACDCQGRCDVQPSWPAGTKQCAHAHARALTQPDTAPKEPSHDR